MDLKTYCDRRRGVALELADAINAPAQLIYQWASGTRPIPKERCPDIEYGTDGAVTVEEQRPDLQWVRVKEKGWPHHKGRPLLDVATVA